MTTSTNGTNTHATTREQNYRRALDACPDIRALDNMVRLIAELGPPRPKKPMCYACIWDSALKPLATLVVGWERGRGVESHTDPDPNNRFPDFDWNNLDTPPREEAASETEEWLRDMEAFDAVTETWIKLLEDVDPALGHGFLARREPMTTDPGITALCVAGVEKRGGATAGLEKLSEASTGPDRDQDPVLHAEDLAGQWEAS